MELECAHCHTRFVRAASVAAKRIRAGASGSYCSAACMQRQRMARSRYATECMQCHKPIWSYHAQKGNVKNERKYCSKACMDASRRKTLQCAKCGKDFTCFRSIARKYCSQACSGNARSNLTRACGYCGSEYRFLPKDIHTSKFCSFLCKVRHEGAARRKSGDEARSRCQRADWRDIRVRVFERDGWACTRCGSGRHLLAHHIVKWRETKDNSMENLVTLCRICHFTVEFGKDIPVFVQERLNGIR